MQRTSRITSLFLCALSATALVACSSTSDPASASGDHSARGDVDGGDHDDGPDNELPLASIASEAKISLRDAIAAGLRARSGHVVEAELEGEIEDGVREVEYSLLIMGSDGVVYSVSVHPGTGEVLEVEEEDDAEELAEVAAVRAAMGATHVSLSDAIAAAESHTGGRALEAEFEADDDGVECEVTVLTDKGLVEVDIDPATGKVLEVEAADDDDDDDEGEHEDDDDDDGDDD